MSDGTQASLLRRAAGGAMRMDQVGLFLSLVPSIALVALLLCVPIGRLFWLSFVDAQEGLTIENYARLLSSPAFFRTLSTTFSISGLVTLICVLVGYPLAYALSELPKRSAIILLTAVILPYWTSVLVRTYAWLVLLQRNGLVNEVLVGAGLVDEPLRLAHNFTGTVIAMTHIMLPFFVLPVYASMRSIDRLYLMAAASVGASPTRAFWSVFAPLSLPGLAAGGFLVFVLCIGFYVTPAILGGGRVIMIAQQIEQSIALYSNWGAASALGVALLLLTSTILLVASRIARLGAYIGR